MEDLLTCAWTWDGQSSADMPPCCDVARVMLTECGGQSQEGVNTLYGAITEVLNRADLEIRANATSILLAFVGQCPRE
jgi:hypothetical protein